MNSDKLFDYLVATDSLDEFLGLDLPDSIKQEIDKLVKDYKRNIINEDEIQDVLMGMEIQYKINYELLFNYFKKQL